MLDVITGSQSSPTASLVAEIPPLAIHFFGFNLGRQLKMKTSFEWECSAITPEGELVFLKIGVSQ